MPLVDTASQELGSTARLGVNSRHRLLFHQVVAIPGYFLEQQPQFYVLNVISTISYEYEHKE